MSATCTTTRVDVTYITYIYYYSHLPTVFCRLPTATPVPTLFLTSSIYSLLYLAPCVYVIDFLELNT